MEFKSVYFCEIVDTSNVKRRSRQSLRKQEMQIVINVFRYLRIKIPTSQQTSLRMKLQQLLA
jgi:hypothetical protein